MMAIEVFSFLSENSHALTISNARKCTLTPFFPFFRSVLARMCEIQMLDVTIPTNDGRQVRLKRYTKPEKVHQLLLDQLGFSLPAQPPPEIRNPMSVVETF
jgi:hypothetical protein